MKDWILYAEQDPRDELIDKILLVRGKSVVDGSPFERKVKWSGTCFMEEDEPGSWLGPIRIVTHWMEI